MPSLWAYTTQRDGLRAPLLARGEADHSLLSASGPGAPTPGVCIYISFAPPVLHACCILQPKCSPSSVSSALPARAGVLGGRQPGLPELSALPGGFCGGWRGHWDSNAVDNLKYHLKVWNCLFNFICIYFRAVDLLY